MLAPGHFCRPYGRRNPAALWAHYPRRRLKRWSCGSVGMAPGSPIPGGRLRERVGMALLADSALFTAAPRRTRGGCSRRGGGKSNHWHGGPMMGPVAELRHFGCRVTGLNQPIDPMLRGAMNPPWSLPTRPSPTIRIIGRSSFTLRERPTSAEEAPPWGKTAGNQASGQGPAGPGCRGPRWVARGKRIPASVQLRSPTPRQPGPPDAQRHHAEAGLELAAWSGGRARPPR